MIPQIGTKEFSEYRKFILIQLLQKVTPLEDANTVKHIAEPASFDNGVTSYCILRLHSYVHVLITCNKIDGHGYKIVITDLFYPDIRITYFWNKTEKNSSWQNITAVEWEFDDPEDQTRISACDILTDVIPKLKSMFGI